MTFSSNQTNFEHTFAAKVSFYKEIDAEDIAAKKVTINGQSESKSLIVRETSNLSTLSVSGHTTLLNLNVTGIATANHLTINGQLKDGDGDFGSAGQVLSSDGTDTKWINTSDANVGSATNVGTNEDGTNANQFVTFVSAKTGNNPIRVDNDLRYNPSTNTMSGINYSGVSTFSNIHVTGQLRDGDGDFGSSGQVLASDGTNTNWVNTGDLSAGAAADVGITDTDANTNFHLTFVENTSGNDNIRVDSDLTYNASSNTLTAGTFSGNASASNLNSGTIPDARFPDTLPAASGTNLTNLPAGNLTGTIPDDRFPTTLPAIDGSNLTGIVSIPTGVIVMWSGATNTIPNGWALCDGQSGTPDLRNRFVVGAGSNYAVDATGGSADATLVAHSHTTNSTSKTLTGDIRGISQSFAQGGGSASGVFTKISVNGGRTANGGSINPCGGVDFDGTHTHDTNSQGSSATNANLPPYYALAYIMKT